MFKGTRKFAFAVAAAGGKIAFAKGYGEANMELHAAFTLDSVVRIASLTKQFTAVAILKLVQESKLQLDDALHAAWPWCGVPCWRPPAPSAVAGCDRPGD